MQLTRMLYRNLWAGCLALLLAMPLMAADLPDFTALVENYGPAVVFVQATGVQGPAAAYSEEDIPEIFRHFFGPNIAPRQGPQARPRVSAGSGFIISADGYLLTNNHVVEGADKVTVRLTDRRELDATVVGTDAQYDIALLKVDADNLPTVNIGDSNKVKPGQWVAAIGSPFGFDHSVTAGIVSAVGRAFGSPEQQYVPFIQTDVPINRGNSGGPLFNLEGQVIGINSQIFSNTGGYMGVSFAIPIDIAMSAVDQIKTSGRVSRGMIGVQIQDVDRDKARALGLSRLGGALVNQVTPGSAGEKAGVQVGDVILAFNGRDIVSSSDLPPLVGATRPGSKATLSVFRNGKTINMPVTIGELPATVADTATGAAPPKGDNLLGMQVQDLTTEQRRQLKLDKEGVLIERIYAGPAQQAGLRAGDIVLTIGRTPVTSASQFAAEVKKVKAGDSVMLLVRRGEQTSFVAVTVPAED